MLLLFLTHQGDQRTLQCFDEVDPGEGFAKELLVDLDAIEVPVGHAATGFTFAALGQSGYSLMGNSIVPGNTPWPVIDRFLATDDDFVWLMEGDVHFRGNWAEFFSSFSEEADLLAPRIRSRHDHPDWPWWNSLRPAEPLTSMQLAAFMPLYRLSRRAAIMLAEKSRAGWRGHHETLVPTLVLETGMKVHDIGWHWYRTHSMRWRPAYGRDEEFLPNQLYHPVK